jgi:hypothetical protein
VVTDEMRHGRQVCYLRISHFGYSGRVETQEMLERQVFESKRSLGALNQVVGNWLGSFTYTDFVGRDGKFQLSMPGHGGLDPLAQSMNPMCGRSHFTRGRAAMAWSAS